MPAEAVPIAEPLAVESAKVIIRWSIKKVLTSEAANTSPAVNTFLEFTTRRQVGHHLADPKQGHPG
jgi:hypothetical protein